MYLQGLPRAPRRRDLKSLGRRATRARTRARTLWTLRTLRTWRRRRETGGNGDVAKDVGFGFWGIFSGIFCWILWDLLVVHRDLPVMSDYIMILHWQWLEI